MCLANVRHRTNLIPSKNFVITQIFQVWIDVVSTYLESRETKDSPNPWYPFLKYLTCSSRHSSNLQKPPKNYNQKEKEEKKKRSKPNGNLCSHILESLKRINDPMKIRRPQSLERLEKNYSMEEWLEATAKVDRRTDTSCSNFFCSRSVFGVDEEAPDAIARTFFCNPNSPKLPTVCTQVDHRRCSGTPSSFTPS